MKALNQGWNTVAEWLNGLKFSSVLQWGWKAERLNVTTVLFSLSEKSATSGLICFKPLIQSWFSHSASIQLQSSHSATKKFEQGSCPFMLLWHVKGHWLFHIAKEYHIHFNVLIGHQKWGGRRVCSLPDPWFFRECSPWSLNVQGGVSPFSLRNQLPDPWFFFTHFSLIPDFFHPFLPNPWFFNTLSPWCWYTPPFEEGLIFHETDG